MKIIVTEEHIRKGKRRDPLNCPIALAIKKHTIWISIVGKTNIFMSNVSIETPEKVADAIAAFDETGTMTPFEFEIDVPRT